MRLLPGLKLVVSFLRLQFVEKVKAGVEFRHVQGLSRNLPGGCQRRSNIKDPCHQRAA
jgi:hypothetical protein